MHRLASAAGGGSRLNFEPTAFGLYAMDSHGWKLWRGLLGALGKDQASSRVAAAIQWSAVAAQMTVIMICLVSADARSAEQNRHTYLCTI